MGDSAISHFMELSSYEMVGPQNKKKSVALPSGQATTNMFHEGSEQTEATYS